MSPQEGVVAPPPPKQDDAFERLKALKAKRKEKGQEKPMSVGGFGENLLQNAWDIAKGFVTMWPKVVEAGGQVFGDPEGLALLAQNPEHLVNAFRDTGKALGNAMIHPYEKHGMRVLYEEPLTPVLDAMTVISLGGGAIAKVGRLADAPRMAEVGAKIASIPERIAGRLLQAPLRAVGINPETRTAFLRIRRHELAGAKLEAGVWKDRIIKGARDLTDADWATVERFVLDGGRKADLLSNPRAAGVYDALQGWLKTARESELGEKGRFLLTDKQMQDRVIRELAERSKLDFQGAKALYESLEVKPLYAPAIKELGEHSNWYNAFSPSVIKTGKVGFLEKFSSAMGALPIKQRLVHAIDDFYRTRARLRLVDRIIQTPGFAKAVKAGDVTLKELLPSGGIFQKYYTEGKAGRSRARSLYISELEAQHGKGKAAQMLASDPATQKALSQAVNIAIPDKTLRGLIAREFRATGGDWGTFLRVYDRITDLFRLSATKLSPRWYTGNVIGDALLSSLAGSNWSTAKRLIEQHLLPRTLKSGGFGLGAETGNRLNTLSDFVGAVDDAARAGIFSKVVADKVRSTMLRFSASEDAMRYAIAEVSLAPDELADIMVRNQQLGEHAARNSRAIQELDGQISETRRALAASQGEDIQIIARLDEAIEVRNRKIAEAKAELEGEAARRASVPRDESLAPGYAQSTARERIGQVEERLTAQRRSAAQQLADKERADILRTGEGLKRGLQKKIDELQRRVAENVAIATELRRNEARLIDLQAPIIDINRELEWYQGLHPRKALEPHRERISQLKAELARRSKEVAPLQRTVDKQRVARAENVALKKELTREKAALAGRISALDEIVSRKSRLVEVQKKYDTLEAAGYTEEAKALLSEYWRTVDELSRGAKPSIPVRPQSLNELKVQAEEWNKEIRILEVQKQRAIETPGYKARAVGPVELPARQTEAMTAIQSKLDTLISTREAAVADLTKNMMAREIDRLPELRRKAEIAEQAIDRANTFLGEYLGLGPIERGVFRRIIPFYPWVKAMSKLAFTFPFIAPKKAFFWHRYASALTELMGDPELPEWMAPYAPIFTRENGDIMWARLTSMSPFGSLRTEHIGGVPVPSILAFWQANPWVSLTFKLAGGKDTFSPGTLPYGEHLVAINDGEVYKFNERGMIEKVLAQPPLIRSAVHMFPVVQMADQIISNYDVRRGSPVLNSDGTVKYPIPFLYRLADAAGLKLMDRKKADVIRSEKLRVRKALEELKKQYRRSGPEDREYIKGIFQDFMKGEYRRIEANQ